MSAQVSALEVTPDGRRCVVGTLKGRCRFYTVEAGGLEYEALIGAESGSQARFKQSQRPTTIQRSCSCR